MMKTSDSVKNIKIIKKITLFSGILAAVIYALAFVVRNDITNAEEATKIKKPTQSSYILNIDIAPNFSVADLLIGFNSETMTIIKDDTSTDTITRYGWTFTKIIPKDGYVWEEGDGVLQFSWNVFPNIKAPEFVEGSETKFEYDGNEHCVAIGEYDWKHIILSGKETAPRSTEEVEANPPVFCATEPGKYYIYAYVVGEMAWIGGEKERKDLEWEIIEEKVDDEDKEGKEEKPEKPEEGRGGKESEEEKSEEYFPIKAPDAGIVK